MSPCARVDAAAGARPVACAARGGAASGSGRRPRTLEKSTWTRRVKSPRRGWTSRPRAGPGEDESTTFTFETSTPRTVSSARAPPAHFMRFDVVKTLRVPVSEPAAVRRGAGGSAESLERWIARPENVMGVVFDDGGVEEIAPNLWRVLVLRLGFLDWELCPEFDLAILPDARTKHASGVRMRSDALRLASEARVAATENAPRRRAPPGFAEMTVWSDIETELYVARGTGGLDGGGAVKGTTAVCADLRITVAADVPWGLRAIPFFQNAGEAAISSSIDGVGKSARARVQAAYEAWVEDRGGGGDGDAGGVPETAAETAAAQ